MNNKEPFTSPETSNDEALQHLIEELGPCFHNIRLRNVETAPNHFLGDFPGAKCWRISGMLPADLTGMSVLDVGCNAGFCSNEMKKNGAYRIVGIDADARYLAQARLAAELSGVAVELIQMSAYDVAARLLAETPDRTAWGDWPPSTHADAGLTFS